MLALIASLLLHPALAAEPRVYVVGLHLPDQAGSAPADAAEALTHALDGTDHSPTLKSIPPRSAGICDIDAWHAGSHAPASSAE